MLSIERAIAQVIEKISCLEDYRQTDRQKTNVTL
jgi:hypothetical protein